MERKLFYFFVLISVAFGSPVPECGPPSELANVITTPSQSAYPLWSRVTFSCEEGYFHSGTAFSYCIESGVWYPIPDRFVCLAQCKEPEAGPNIVHFPFGRDPEATQTLYNDEDVVQYACAEGQGATLVGPTQATCKNGFWEPAKMPSCNHCSAPLVSDPKTVQLSPNQQSYAAYAEVTLSCPDDVMYTAKGTNITYCEENGEWIPDPTKMTCHDVSSTTSSTLTGQPVDIDNDWVFIVSACLLSILLLSISAIVILIIVRRYTKPSSKAFGSFRDIEDRLRHLPGDNLDETILHDAHFPWHKNPPSLYVYQSTLLNEFTESEVTTINQADDDESNPKTPKEESENVTTRTRSSCC